MQVTVSPEAAAFIKEKGGHILIFRGQYSGCCVGSVPAPKLDVGKPRNPPENYKIVEISGVTVHIDKELNQFSGTADISLDKALRWRTLSLQYRE